MSKKETFPEFDLVMNLLKNKVGSFIEPVLFHVSSGARKGSSNFHYAANGMYFYGNIKKQHINDAGNTCLTLRCPNFQSKNVIGQEDLSTKMEKSPLMMMSSLIQTIGLLFRIPQLNRMQILVASPSMNFPPL